MTDVLSYLSIVDRYHEGCSFFTNKKGVCLSKLYMFVKTVQIIRDNYLAENV